MVKEVVSKRKDCFQVWSSSFGGYGNGRGSYFADGLTNTDQEIQIDCLKVM